MSTVNTKWVAALAGITLTLNMNALLGHIRSNPTPVLPPLLDEGGGLVDVDVDASDHLEIGHNDHDEHLLRQTHAAAAAAPVHKTSGVEPGYTIVLNTFRRNPCLKVALDHWVTCHPTSIVVVWPDPESPLPDYAASYGDLVEFVRYPGTNLTYRFYPHPFRTEAVFSIDDDCTYTCAAVDAAFGLWHQDPLNEMVGFAPRKLHPDGGYWNAEPHQNGIYNTLFPTKGAFLHKRFYELYWAPKLEWVRNIIDTNVTAEDILMSSIHAAETGRAPIAVQVLKEQRTLMNFCGGQLVGKGGWPSVEQRRKVIGNAIFDALGGCPKSVCRCKCCGTSSSDCSCEWSDKTSGGAPLTSARTKPSLSTRCGYPFAAYPDSTRFFNISTLEVEDDPRGCIKHGKGKAFNKDGCFGGIFI